MPTARCSHPFHIFPMHIPAPVEYQTHVRKTKGIKAPTQRNSLPAGYRISRVEENYYLRASHWLRTYLPSYWLSESNRTFLIPGKLLFTRRYILLRQNSREQWKVIFPFEMKRQLREDMSLTIASQSARTVASMISDYADCVAFARRDAQFISHYLSKLPLERAIGVLMRTRWARTGVQTKPVSITSRRQFNAYANCGGSSQPRSFLASTWCLRK